MEPEAESAMPAIVKDLVLAAGILPRFRSRKSVGSSGGGFKLAPDRFLDLRARAFVVISEIADRLSELVALGNDPGSETRPGDEGTPTRKRRINQDQGRITPERMPGKGVELDRDPAPIALDSLEGTGDDFPDDRLTRAAEIDELSVVVGEDMNAIGRQHATDERMARVDRRLREPRQVLDCLSNGRHLHPVPASKRGQDVKLGEVQERDERRRTRRRNVDEW